MLNRMTEQGKEIVVKQVRKGVVTFIINDQETTMNEEVFKTLFPKENLNRIRLSISKTFEKMFSGSFFKLFTDGDETDFSKEDTDSSIELAFVYELPNHLEPVDIPGFWKNAKDFAKEIEDNCLKTVGENCAKVYLHPELLSFAVDRVHLGCLAIIIKIK